MKLRVSAMVVSGAGALLSFAALSVWVGLQVGEVWSGVLATLLGSLATAGAMVFAALQFRTSEKARVKSDADARAVAEDELKRQARLVLVALVGGSAGAASVEILIDNLSDYPVMELIAGFGEITATGLVEKGRTAVDQDLHAMRPGQLQKSVRVQEPVPLGLAWVSFVEFTDIAGRRWRRVNNSQPGRVLDGR